MHIHSVFPHVKWVKTHLYSYIPYSSLRRKKCFNSKTLISNCVISSDARNKEALWATPGKTDVWMRAIWKSFVPLWWLNLWDRNWKLNFNLVCCWAEDWCILLFFLACPVVAFHCHCKELIKKKKEIIKVAGCLFGNVCSVN